MENNCNKTTALTQIKMFNKIIAALALLHSVFLWSLFNLFIFKICGNLRFKTLVLRGKKLFVCFDIKKKTAKIFCNAKI